MTLLVNSFQKLPAGYGHYTISVYVDGKKYSTVTSNMPGIDNLSNEDEGEARNQRHSFAVDILSANDFSDEEIESLEFDL